MLARNGAGLASAATKCEARRSSGVGSARISKPTAPKVKLLVPSNWVSIGDAAAMVVRRLLRAQLQQVWR
jgi:hypothetical protein